MGNFQLQYTVSRILAIALGWTHLHFWLLGRVKQHTKLSKILPISTSHKKSAGYLARLLAFLKMIDIEQETEIM